MCSYIVTTAPLTHSSAKGPAGWTPVDLARISFDHPYHSTLDHALGIDIVSQADGGTTRLALELSPDSARALVGAILAALDSGERAHGPATPRAHALSVPSAEA
jgi:hypothetical protein